MSSATQTKHQKGKTGKKSSGSASGKSVETGKDAVAIKLNPVASKNSWLILLAIALLGWLRIFASYDWTFTPSVVFLLLGWAAILLVFVFLWNGIIALVRPGAIDDAFGLARDFRSELEVEKRSVLKAIKEIEFDRESGKMSDADAEEIVRLYRSRAIDILKEIDRLDAGETATAKDVIDREVRARLKLLGVATAAKKRAGKSDKEKASSADSSGETGDKAIETPKKEQSEEAEAKADEENSN